MGTTLAIVAAVVLLLIAAYLLWTRRLERVRNAELTVKLVHAQAELIARRVQVEQLAGHKHVIPQPRPQARPKRERPPYLKPLAVVGGGVVTFAAWLRDHAAVTAALAAASAMLMLTPSVAPPPSPPPFAEPDQGTTPPYRQEFPKDRAEPPPRAEPAPPSEDPSTTPPETPAQTTPVEPEPAEQPSAPPESQPGQQPPPDTTESPPEEPSEPEGPPCIVVTVPPEVNPESCLDISL